MMDEALANEKANREAIRDLAVAPPGPYRPGDTVTITWNCDPRTVARVNIDFSPGPGMWAAVPIAESAPVAGPEGGSFVWKIPASITATGKNQRESSHVEAIEEVLTSLLPGACHCSKLTAAAA
jgi:hypothetical protein